MSNHIFFLKLFYCFTLISLFSFSNSTVNLNFYSWHYPNKNTLSNIVKNHILTDIYIGSNNQKISLNILFYSTGLFIIDKNRTNDPDDFIAENNIYYDKNTSSSFKVIYEKDEDRAMGTNFNFKREIRSIRVTDSIELRDDKNNIIPVKNIEFFLAKKLTKLPYGAGIIGLDLNNRYLSTWQYSGFISELTNKNIIKNENFLISFNSYEDGKVIIGLDEIPINNNKYEEFELYEYKWELSINGIEYGPGKIENDAKIKFKISVNPIIGINLYDNYIKENFFYKYNLFDKKNPICEIKFYDIYNVTICNKSIEKYFDKFPNLSFNFNKNKIIFKAEDLFKKLDYLDEEKNIGKINNNNNLNENEQRYVFMILINRYKISYESEKEWRLGKIFFEKVDLFFDSKRFKIGLIFKNTQILQNNEFLLFSSNKSFGLFILLILIFVFIFYICCITIKNKDNKGTSKKNRLLNSNRKKEINDEKCIYKEMNDIN